MLIAPFRASSCGPIFQYRLFYLLKFILSKNFEIIRCYSEVMTSPFYIVKLESFTIEGMPTRSKNGLPTEVTFWTFRSHFKHCVVSGKNGSASIFRFGNQEPSTTFKICFVPFKKGFLAVFSIPIYRLDSQVNFFRKELTKVFFS